MPPTTWAAFYTARAYFELGEIAAARSDTATAIRRYGAPLRLLQLNRDPASGWTARTATALAAVGGRLER